MKHVFGANEKIYDMLESLEKKFKKQRNKKWTKEKEKKKTSKETEHENILDLIKQRLFQSNLLGRIYQMVLNTWYMIQLAALDHT